MAYKYCQIIKRFEVSLRRLHNEYNYESPVSSIVLNRRYTVHQPNISFRWLFFSILFQMTTKNSNAASLQGEDSLYLL